MVKFKLLKWSGYEIRLLHDKSNMRRSIALIPYFWDDDISFTLVLKAIGDTRQYDDVWKYEWELVDLDNNCIKSDKDSLDVIREKGVRRFFTDWTSGKRRAIVLGNLKPNMNYILKITFTNGTGESLNETMATFSIKDRSDFYMQIFLILFSVIAALVFSVLLKGCGG